MKGLVIGLLVLFLGFWMVQDPSGMGESTADLAGWTWDTLSMVFTAGIDFVGGLVG